MNLKISSSILAVLLCLEASVSAHNILDNGDFEKGFDNGWSHLSGSNGSSANFSAETGDPYEGSTALKVIVSSLGSNAWDIQTLGHTVILTEGEDYTFKLWGKTSEDGTSTRMIIQNSNFLSNDVIFTTEWAEYTWTFTAGESNPSVRFHHFDTGTFWIDDLRIERVEVNTGPVDLTISPEVRHQEMVGFGGALSWYAQRAVSSPHSEEIFQLMFEDLGMDFLRLKNWYYPVNYPSSKEGVGASFNANKQFHEAAKAANPDIKILLSSWSPPVNLKSNGDREGGGTLKKDGDRFMYDEFAQYWVDALVNMGFIPDYLSIQNEPGYQADWESCIFRPTETDENAGYAEAVDAVWKAIKDLPDVPQMIGSDAENIGSANWSDWKGGASINTFREFTEPLQSRDHIVAYAYHIYNMYNESRIDGINGEFNMVRDEFGDKVNFMTEFSRDSFDWIEAAQAVHNTVTEANASAYNYWKLVWGPANDNMITIEPNGSYTVDPHYYLIKHYSKYVDIGYTRIEVGGSNNDLKISGYLSPDGLSLTLVLINKSNDSKELNLLHNSLPVGSALAFQSVDGNFFQELNSIDVSRNQTVPGRSMTTYVLEMSASLNELNEELVYLFDPRYDGSSFSVKTPNQDGIQFSLWETDDLKAGIWSEVTTASQMTENGVITFTDDNPGTLPRFYKVKASK